MSVQRHVISETSPAAASTVVGATVGGLSKYDALAIYATLTGATGGALDVYLQTSFDDGVTWYDWGHYPQRAAGAAAIAYSQAFDLRGLATTPTVVGKGTLGTPAVALAVNTFLGGAWGDRIRAVYVAGAGTSAGAAQLIEIMGYMRAR